MTHKITRITLVPPDGVDWECECGTTGRCPQPVAARLLAEHLAPGETMPVPAGDGPPVRIPGLITPGQIPDHPAGRAERW